MYGYTFVPMSNPGLGPMRVPSMALLDLVFSFSFLVQISLSVSTHFSLRVVLEGAATSLAHQGGGPQPGSFKDRFKPFVCPGLY